MPSTAQDRVGPERQRTAARTAKPRRAHGSFMPANPGQAVVASTLIIACHDEVQQRGRQEQDNSEQIHSLLCNRTNPPAMAHANPVRAAWTALQPTCRSCRKTAKWPHRSSGPQQQVIGFFGSKPGETVAFHFVAFGDVRPECQSVHFTVEFAAEIPQRKDRCSALRVVLRHRRECAVCTGAQFDLQFFVDFADYGMPRRFAGFAPSAEQAPNTPDASVHPAFVCITELHRLQCPPKPSGTDGKLHVRRGFSFCKAASKDRRSCVRPVVVVSGIIGGACGPLPAGMMA